MKDSTVVKMYLGVCLIAGSFLVYGVLHEGLESNLANIYWTVGIFGGVGLFWAVYNKLARK